MRPRLDGLNKPLNSWSWGFHIHNYNMQCESRRVPKLLYPRREYIIQVARFDPAKGIPDLVKSYARLRQYYMKDTPQLVM
jgi:glycosyltransferase involved in cell wall biosynthesis